MNGSGPPQFFVNGFVAGDRVVLLRREQDGSVSKHLFPAEYACHIRREDFAADIEAQAKRSRAVRGYAIEGDWVRLRWASYDVARSFCGRGGYFEQRGIATYEGDLNPVRRVMVERGFSVQRPRWAILDIETDSRVPMSQKSEARVLCWSLTFEDGEKVRGVLEHDTDEAETLLLEDLFDELMSVDLVLAWYGGDDWEDDEHGFDFPVLGARVARLGIRVNLRRWLTADHLAIFRKGNISASESGEEKQSMALGRVAARVLHGEADVAKLSVEARKSWDYWAAGGEQRALLSDYNVVDTELAWRIEKRTGFIELMIELCLVCGTFPDARGMRATSFVESFILRLARERGGGHFPSRFQTPGEADPFAGAYVMEPKHKGVLRGVDVADFAAMYPRNIVAWNMSLETHVPEAAQRLIAPNVDPRVELVPPPPGYCRVPMTGEVFRTEPKGLLVVAVEEIARLREQWKRAKAAAVPGTDEWKDADRRSTAYKQINNSFYGVVGSPFSRFFRRQIAESVAQAGVWLIKSTIAYGREQHGIETIAVDTDSVFAAGVEEQRFRTFVEACNRELYPKLLASCGCRPPFGVKLAYEKRFSILVYVKKKRYAGRFEHFDGKRANELSRPEIKGLEFKRGDSARLAREMQEEAVRVLLCMDRPEAPAVLPYTHRDFCELADRWRARVLKGRLERDDFVLSKQLSREIEGYARRKKKHGDEWASQAVHVELARRMRELGMDVSQGVRIEYVVVDGARSPQKVVGLFEFEPGTEDRHYLWETLVWPPTERVLEVCFPDYDWHRSFGRSRPRERGRPVPREQMGFGF